MIKNFNKIPDILLKKCYFFKHNLSCIKNIILHTCVLEISIYVLKFWRTCQFTTFSPPYPLSQNLLRIDQRYKKKVINSKSDNSLCQNVETGTSFVILVKIAERILNIISEILWSINILILIFYFLFTSRIFSHFCVFSWGFVESL
jgi:hypothetical protein